MDGVVSGATRGNTLRHAATRGNTLHRTATIAIPRNTLQRTLQHTYEYAGLTFVRVYTCVAVCCSVAQYVAVCCSVDLSVLQGVAGCKFIAVCCWAHVCSSAHVCCSVLQCVSTRCSVLQRAAVCCSVLQCAAVRCWAFLLIYWLFIVHIRLTSLSLKFASLFWTHE